MGLFEPDHNRPEVDVLLYLDGSQPMAIGLGCASVAAYGSEPFPVRMTLGAPIIGRWIEEKGSPMDLPIRVVSDARDERYRILDHDSVRQPRDLR
jgi:hypothetical protein